MQSLDKFFVKSYPNLFLLGGVRFTDSAGDIPPVDVLQGGHQAAFVVRASSGQSFWSFVSAIGFAVQYFCLLIFRDKTAQKFGNYLPTVIIQGLFCADECILVRITKVAPPRLQVCALFVFVIVIVFSCFFFQLFLGQAFQHTAGYIGLAQACLVGTEHAGVAFKMRTGGVDRLLLKFIVLAHFAPPLFWAACVCAAFKSSSIRLPSSFL